MNARLGRATALTVLSGMLVFVFDPTKGGQTPIAIVGIQPSIHND